MVLLRDDEGVIMMGESLYSVIGYMRFDDENIGPVHFEVMAETLDDVVFHLMRIAMLNARDHDGSLLKAVTITYASCRVGDYDTAWNAARQFRY